MLEIMITYGMSFIGTPYVYGGNNCLEGFDCSSFVQEVLASVGLDPKRDQTAQNLYDILKEKEWRSQLSRGAIVFYGKSRDNISHVAIALGNNLNLEAGGGDRFTVNKEVAREKGACVRIRPLRKDIVAVIMPLYNKEKL